MISGGGTTRLLLVSWGVYGGDGRQYAPGRSSYRIAARSGVLVWTVFLGWFKYWLCVKDAEFQRRIGALGEALVCVYWFRRRLE